MEKVVICVAIMAALAKVVTVYLEKRRKKAHQAVLQELGEFSWSGAKDALAKLVEIYDHADHKQVRQVARHYLTVWVGDLTGTKVSNLKAALEAKTRFGMEMKEIRKLTKFFGLTHHEISPFSESEMLASHLRCQVEVLEQALEHYPEKAWLVFSPGDILSGLLTCADTSYANNNIERWRGWIRTAYLRQAKRELRRLRRGQYFSPEETNASVDKILTLLGNAKAEPEEIETTTAELTALRKAHQYA